MNKRIKKEWVRRLRSGNWTQTAHTLRVKGKQRCCLGVLCDIAAKEGVGKWEKDDFNCNYFVSGKHMDQTRPTIEVRKWADVNLRTTNKLIRMNDVDGKSFKEIADYIQKYL